jgi:REP element-mobilizing transposase RayT
MSEHKQWHSRGYLPHFDAAHVIQSVTYRLADSLPQSKLLERWDSLTLSEKIRRQNELEDFLDQGAGECVLSDFRCAGLVQDQLLRFDAVRYRLLAWSVMPNHVHVMFQMFDGYPLGQVVHSWKGASAFGINRLLGRSGPLWRPEYFDRFIRDSDHYDNVLMYIEYNAVKAKLCSSPELWPFSSAAFRSQSNSSG